MFSNEYNQAEVLCAQAITNNNCKKMRDALTFLERSEEYKKKNDKAIKLYNTITTFINSY